MFNNTGNETDLAEREYVHTHNKFAVTKFYCNDKLSCRSVVPGEKIQIDILGSTVPPKVNLRCKKLCKTRVIFCALQIAIGHLNLFRPGAATDLQLHVW